MQKRKHTWIWHLLLWLVSMVIFFQITKSPSLTNILLYPLADFYYVLSFHLTLIAVVYLCRSCLMPLLSQKRQYALFVLGLLGLASIGALANEFYFNHITDYILEGVYVISYYDFEELFVIHLVYLVLTALLTMSSSYFEAIQASQQLALIEQQKTAVELKALKAQLDPHLLFNTLNNIYGMSLKRDPNTPEVILKLSNTMRYLLYETNQSQVLLAQEIEMLREYIDLQRLRIGVNSQVSLEVVGEVSEQKIAPLLLLPLIENAFKHGVKADVQGTFVTITIKVSKNRLDLTVINNLVASDKVSLDKTTGGLGLSNLEKRLALLYPEAHTLSHIQKDNQYLATLSLKLTQDDLSDSR
ncbi:sensor histidine kinase [Penaeicola halotolerans]|uniref:sensor histidine kinase n=1 Tax=Penaeicola halotolerans TaxID=2793196 RepID=UPI001CF8FE36|nr:histidine kinase [Penaeicola halotolerans]